MQRSITPVVMLLVAGCGGSDAVEVVRPVATAASLPPPATTDLGHVVELQELRVAVFDLAFTIEGEQHGVARLSPAPHPGHASGGEVTGELPGPYILRWDGGPQPVLGDARLIVGDYRGANVGLRAADAADGLAAGDPLTGHTFHLRGVVTLPGDGASRPFDAVLDVERESAIIGAVFEHAVVENATETLTVAFLATDPVESDTVFDGIDFATLPVTDGVLSIRPGTPSHNVLRRAMQVHDHYAVTPE